ncbi:MAG: hypothetical protein JW991_00855 [Candidatus Pacebacteria bacterium]|nr:hypothetical protein [Candidatus Paceibacterota bacterium]
MIDPAFFTLQKNKLKLLLAWFKNGNWARIVVAGLTTAIFISLALGVFGFAYAGFSFLGQYPEASEPIIAYTLAVTFILTLSLTTFSAFATSLTSLFQKDDNHLLLSLPIRSTIIFESRLIDIVLISSWPLLVFGLPQTLGYGLGVGLDWGSIFIFLFGFLTLALFSALAGVITAMIISRLWGNLKSAALSWFSFLLTPFLAWGLIKILLPAPLLVNLESLSIPEIASLIKNQFFLYEFLPTTWLVNLIIYWPQQSRLALQNLALIFLAYLALLIFAALLKDAFYRKTVNQTAAGKFIAGDRDQSGKKGRFFPYFLPGRIGALIEKDWLVIFRSPGQFFQLLFIVFLELIYFLIVSQIPIARIRQLFPIWYENKIMALNFLFISYLATVLAMKFLFPLISLEGQSSWIIWSAPISRKKVFGAKLISSFLIILIWLEASTALSLKTLDLSLSSAKSFFLANLPLALTLTALTLGIGAIKPNFWEKNAEVLSTSPSGLTATLLCLIYTGLVSFLLFTQKELNFNFQAIIWLISLLLIIPILFEASRRIQHHET